jgi:hypothetical protein
LITYFAVRQEGGVCEEIPHAEWESLWIERPEDFCALGIAFYWEDRENQFGKWKTPHGFAYDFILRRLNQERGTNHAEWRAVP